ncbi:Lrp/AsnC family transcriptional regulator [Diaphorobacter aerolatus]|uniref:Lrp/AsnC family transcriptional regulator n=1 Tax=Diaphorobacter aerolatus TaxID=1288495 RepID=A0A7H0GQ50_9BURK|nr:Lrp/AsnC family transcriptional regulator [Diaphorobacter aerolatus]QNP50416.1 Lrp/AsnC family transcriptional regulator [Diaphorobacter aerolatus]
MNREPLVDPFDEAILAILQSNNLTPQREIADHVHLSPAAVQRRIRRLQDSGVIASNVAVLDPEALGRPLTIFIAVQLVNELDALTAGFRARVAAEPAVQQCYSVTGDTDYLLIVTASDMQEYQALTRRLFDGDQNIQRFTTSIALATLKRGLQLPLAQSRAGS